MGRIVLDKARTASYIPYTRGAQDVIETVFATQVTFAAWPQHEHGYKGVVDYKACAAMTRARLGITRPAYEAIDRPLLEEERKIIAELEGGIR